MLTDQAVCLRLLEARVERASAGRARLFTPMALTIRIAKTAPSLDRRTARARAEAAAQAKGHHARVLEKATVRLERVDGPPFWEYVVEFPNASG
jgi:hypothetical protein